MPENALSPIAVTLAELKQAGLTQSAVAEKLGIPRTDLSRYASGTRRPPAVVYRGLAPLLLAARIPTSLTLAADHESWLQVRRRVGGPQFTFSCQLPRGVTAEAAIARCQEAVRALAAGARK